MASNIGIDSYWKRRRNTVNEVTAAIEMLENSTDLLQNDIVIHEHSNDQALLDVNDVAFEFGLAGQSDGGGDLSSPDLTNDKFDFVDYLCDAGYSRSDSESERSDDDHDDEHICESLTDELRSLTSLIGEWAVEYSVPLTAVGSLLKLLKPYHPELPKDARTLLTTPRSNAICNLSCGGQYVHLGIANGIEDLARSGCLETNQTVLCLQFNIDGLPLFKSSNTSLWPILCIVRNSLGRKPFVVGSFCGQSKPENLQLYFAEFVTDLKGLMKEGLHCNGVNYQLAIDSFVCDAPARAMVKNVKGHSGYSSCEKCHDEGEWFGKVTFQNTNANLRTDAEFAEMSDTEHHLGRSALCDLPLGMVTQFPLDYMHLVCLGVVRRLLLSWMKGPLITRLPAASIKMISDKLVSLIPYFPREFARKPRALNEIMRWKATELRTFLLYTGPVVLKNVLSDSLYNNFMLLSVAIMLLVRPELCTSYCVYAKELLIVCVENMKKLYGEGMIVYNVHGLIHLADDAKKFGILDNFSAFPFENMLKSLKRLIRKPNLPLQQLVNRLAEQKQHLVPAKSPNLGFMVKKEHFMGPLPAEHQHAKQYLQFRIDGMFFSVHSGDNCVQLKDSRVCVICNILVDGGIILLVVKFIESWQTYFEYPLPSTQLSVVNVKRWCASYDIVPATDIANKALCLPTSNNSFVVFPLCHMVCK